MLSNFQFSLIWLPIAQEIAIIKCTCSPCFRLQTANTSPIKTSSLFILSEQEIATCLQILWSRPLLLFTDITISTTKRESTTFTFQTQLQEMKKREICSPVLKHSLYLWSTEILKMLLHSWRFYTECLRYLLYP